MYERQHPEPPTVRVLFKPVFTVRTLPSEGRTELQSSCYVLVLAGYSILCDKYALFDSCLYLSKTLIQFLLHIKITYLV